MSGNIAAVFLLLFCIWSTIADRTLQSICPDECRLICRKRHPVSSSEGNSGYCFCRCDQRSEIERQAAVVYSITVEDIWHVRCGYLPHPFLFAAMALNDTGLLYEFVRNRCISDYSTACRAGQPETICSQEWSASLCMQTCTQDRMSSSDLVSRSSFVRECPPDSFFQSKVATYGNPYSGCRDFHRGCQELYEQGYCELKPEWVACQNTCGRCVGDESYIPWNPLRAQLLSWVRSRTNDNIAQSLMSNFALQYSDYIEEVHRSCSTKPGYRSENVQRFR